ncbi:MAG: glycosyl transferase family 4 [uncultured bacterium]|uniref:Glycosyl transferase family 4 n=3 Tax=Candidatus Daviesiibacteriota TaxID=1752718 RepID=A0A0G0I1N9_9BACT|nr:MAG: glycosyl transferase family 4 [uncultured bacterium]KKQ10031.1 MAG: Glycosyl transferase family 4 [Candidatus Daviesbacteria bacterium GW2011_GWB1_36_5]KKQ15918.1 MAG: Glycosyl transferase family 4 [Candidatus Daviesbacteria bacterium GW2011_GWA1_36_8]OGE30791.1 MAG: hypothetical protein A3C99_00610 [Candidatus Daviesbacteria bacterium RIFCSPHIGHO2_02_FULL_37_9]OGE35183.1 MAG: hypothetical protein A3E66_02000 [Candidatus Daviesbacteria bacterium RIFCSPHIGHO2_12_FULL_37_16]
MDTYLPFLVSLLITVVTIPFTIIFARKYNLVDDPNTRPHPAHIQKRVVPRAGGLPIFLAIFFSILFFVPLDKHILGIIFAMLLLLAIGLLDDALKNFSPISRLFFQIIAAAIVVISGVGITFVTNPFGGFIHLDQLIIPVNFFGSHQILLFADLLALVWIVWMMNIINWSKGVDGQMPSIILVASLTIFLLSSKLILRGETNQQYIQTLSLITAGTSLGFLFFNWYPAKIFPGFSGSTILGFMIATLSILSGAKLATALLVLLVPTTDFLYTFFRRILQKKLPFIGDQQHLHHLLLNKGWSHQRISLFYLISCAILGLLSTTLSSQGKLFTVLTAGVVILGLILWLHFYKQEKD